MYQRIMEVPLIRQTILVTMKLQCLITGPAQSKSAGMDGDSVPGV